jgi:hypothetical protein
MFLTNKCRNKPLELDFGSLVVRLNPLQTKEIPPNYADFPLVKSLVNAGELAIKFPQVEPVQEMPQITQEDPVVATEVSEEPSVEISAMEEVTPATTTKRIRQK